MIAGTPSGPAGQLHGRREPAPSFAAAGAVAESHSRRTAPAPVSVRLRIGRLALDGLALDARQQSGVRQTVEAEIGRLLAGDRLAPRLRHGGSARRPPGGERQNGSWTDSEDLGRQIARALHEGIMR